MRLFRKSEEKVAQEAAVQVEIDRIRAFTIEDLAITVLPALGPETTTAGHHVRAQQLCNYLLQDLPGAGQVKPLQLMARVRRALDLLEDAGLVSSMAYARSPVWRITPAGDMALAEGTTEQRLRNAG